jgi:hypothetical protein
MLKRGETLPAGIQVIGARTLREALDIAIVP